MRHDGYMRLQVGDVRLFFDTEGSVLVPDGASMARKQTIVLLHGGPGADHSLFKPEFSAMTDAAFLVYLDQRGSGRSDRSEQRLDRGSDLHLYGGAMARQFDNRIGLALSKLA